MHRKINLCNVHCTFVQCFVQLQCVEVHWPRRDAPGKSCTAFSSSLTKMGQKASKIWPCLAIADALFRAQSALKKWSNDQKDTLSSDNLVLCMAIWLSLANIQLHKKEQGTRYDGKQKLSNHWSLLFIFDISLASGRSLKPLETSVQDFLVRCFIKNCWKYSSQDDPHLWTANRKDNISIIFSICLGKGQANGVPQLVVTKRGGNLPDLWNAHLEKVGKKRLKIFVVEKFEIFWIFAMLTWTPPALKSSSGASMGRGLSLHLWRQWGIVKNTYTMSILRRKFWEVGQILINLLHP